MAKVGIAQGNPLAALGNILRKGPGRGSGRESKSPRRDIPVTKKSSITGSKESLRDSSKESAESPGKSSEPKSPKMFRFGIRRSSSRNKKGDDAASDTSSVNSLNVVSVRQEPVDTEPSHLTVSRSADESVKKEESVNKKPPEANDDRSKNRRSAYFKPPEVEALPDLFASGELDALLKKEEGNDEQETVQENTEEKDEDDFEEKVGSEGGLKRNNLRSSFRMYENRYRAETLEKKKSPLSTSVSSAGVPEQSTRKRNDDSPLTSRARDKTNVIDTTNCNSNSGDEVEITREGGDAEEVGGSRESAVTMEDMDTREGEEAQAEDAVNIGEGVDGKDKEGEHARGKKRSEDDDQVTIKSEEGGKESGYAGDKGSLLDDSKARKLEKDKERERKRRKLFDDELFASDVLTRPRVKTPSAATPSLDAYAKAHQEQKTSVSSQEAKEVASTSEMSGIVIAETSSNQQSVKGDESRRSSERSQKEQSPSSVKDGDSSQDTNTGPTEGDKLKAELAEQNLSESRLEENEVNEEVSEKPNENTTVSDSVALNTPESIASQKDDKNATEEGSISTETKDDLQTKPSSSVKDSTGGRRSSPSSRRLNSSKIQSGKVSNARSKFDSGSTTPSSPRQPRTRASTEVSHTQSDRKVKRSEKEPPTWMSDLQKKREQRTKESTTTKKSLAGDDEENMPDWRKRVLQRRRKAAEANTKLPKKDGKSSALSSKDDDKPSRASKSPQRNISTDVSKSPSPSRSKTKGAATSKVSGSASKENKVATEDTDKSPDAAEDHDEQSGKAPCTTEEETSSNIPENNLDLRTPSATSEATSSEVAESTPSDSSEIITSPKPNITSPKPKIEIATKKVNKESVSSDQLTQSTLSIEVKPSTTSKTDEAKGDEGDDEVFTTASEELEVSSTTSKKVASECHDTSDSRKGSNSSEKDVGVPFRSRGISQSRSPTPTSVTPGPLKLPADPGVPEWKKKVLERKKDQTTVIKKPPSSKKEPEVPAWKKELMSKRAKIGEEVRSYNDRFITVRDKSLSINFSELILRTY